MILLRRTPTHRVYRISGRNGSFILKWFSPAAKSIEPGIYRLLAQAHIPTLPAYENTGTALVLEDLQSSPKWRLAEPADMGRPTTGHALAAWYRSLHQASCAALKDHAGRKLGSSWVGDNVTAGKSWCRIQAGRAGMGAAISASALKAKYLELPQAFNYHDFAENLAYPPARGSPFSNRLRRLLHHGGCFQRLEECNVFTAGCQDTFRRPTALWMKKSDYWTDAIDPVRVSSCQQRRTRLVSALVESCEWGVGKEDQGSALV
jgi:hypothetical protein